jgi:hypothetical protein
VANNVSRTFAPLSANPSRNPLRLRARALMIASAYSYDYPAKEVLVKVLGYLLARLGIRLVWAVVEFVANWSLDTVNTIPLVRSPGREHT